MKAKLTAKDLMVGEWVKIKEPNKYAGAIGTIQSISSLEGAYFAIYINDPNFGTFVTEVFCEDIEPIPLTAEILEKNGFIKHRDIMYRFAVHIDEFNGFMFTLGRDFDGVFCLQSNRFVRFAYVHELQHALRLCRVDKEIVL